MLGVILSQVHGLALGLVGLHEVLMNPSFRHIRFSIQLGITCKLAEDVLNPSLRNW